jgi:hypothetical protein
MAGLVPAIHVGVYSAVPRLRADGAETKVGSSGSAAPGHDVDGRDKPGHDTESNAQAPT